MNKVLMNAILAMDSYNRGYLPKISGLGGDFIGLAALGDDSSILDTPGNDDVAQKHSFYAISYTYNGETIISYRGTDAPLDVANGWITGVGAHTTDQAMMAAEFYKNVIGDSNPYNVSVTFTGHSLGAGLAGLMASLYGQDAVVFDNMPFELAANSAYLDSIPPLFTGSEDDLKIKNTYYFNGAEPQLPNSSGVSAYATTGEILASARGAQSTPVTYLNSHAFFQSAVDLHSQALLVTLLYAKTNGVATDWTKVGVDFINALFDNSVAAAISGTLDADQMLNKIAYSAIDEGTTIFGDTAIRAL